jgi:hypothetical protein
MDDERQTNDWPAGMTGRGVRGRRIARLMIVIAIVLPVMLGVLILSAPHGMGGGPWVEPPDPTLPAVVVGVGILAYIAGLAVMIRIYRADPEAHQSFWRSTRN